MDVVPTDVVKRNIGMFLGQDKGTHNYVLGRTMALHPEIPHSDILPEDLAQAVRPSLAIVHPRIISRRAAYSYDAPRSIESWHIFGADAGRRGIMSVADVAPSRLPHHMKVGRRHSRQKRMKFHLTIHCFDKSIVRDIEIRKRRHLKRHKTDKKSNHPPVYLSAW